MCQIICFVGKSGSGKTTLMERLIPVFRRRGYSVGTIKHGAHGFEMDKEGKDSYRHARAGSEVVVIGSTDRVGMIRKTRSEWSLDQLANLAADMDIILVEGYRKSGYPKIEVFRPEVSRRPLCLLPGTGGEWDPDCIGIVCDSGVLEGIDIPRFGFDDLESIVDHVETSVANFSNLKQEGMDKSV